MHHIAHTKKSVDIYLTNRANTNIQTPPGFCVCVCVICWQLFIDESMNNKVAFPLSKSIFFFFLI